MGYDIRDSHTRLTRLKICNKKDVLYLFYPIIFVLLPTFFGGYLEGLVNLGVYLSILEE